MHSVLMAGMLATGLAAAVRFDDSASDRLRITGDTYQVSFARSNGALLGIAEGEKILTAGSRNACLWGTNYAGTNTYRGGCSYGAGRPEAFTWEWIASDNLLRLKYESAAGATQRMNALVTVLFEDETFAMRLELQNAMGLTLQTALFPSDLVFNDREVDAAYLPYYLPGVKLKRAFFEQNRNTSITYPGARAFADHVALEVNGGRLAWYTVNPEGPVAPASFGFQDDERTRAGTFYATHNFQTWTPDGQAFETPWVRFVTGRTVEGTIGRYRVENRIDTYPSIAEKLGDSFSASASAPLIKMDLRQINAGFRELIARIDGLRPPALLHPVSYWPRGFDQNYPDFLPPDARFGTNDDFRAFIAAAHERGLLVMPYTNPTWWDEASPASRAAASISELAVLDAEGRPRYESYGVNRGFVTSPHAAAVRARVAELMRLWRDEVPADFVFQDQIGSRDWIRDFNPAAPGPRRYSDAWLELTREHAPQRLMTEDGWDRVAATHVGFAGSALTGTTAWTPATLRWGQGSRANTAFGAGTWEPYPLAGWLFHDKVLFYHHDLDDRPMNGGPEVLTWNAAFGVMGGFLWPELRSMAGSEWPAIVSAFQPAVLARTAGRLLSGYRTLAPDVTESRFGDLAVIANWDASTAYELDGFKIAPSGCLARSEDGAVLGGVFVDRFNGEALSPGTHYLLVETAPDVIQVRQPSGADTPVTVALPKGWEAVRVEAVGRDGRRAVAANVRETGVNFVWSGAAGVDRYEIRLLQ